MTAPTRELPRLLDHYRSEIAPALQQEFGLTLPEGATLP